jgi:RHS repeat-associated protein
VLTNRTYTATFSANLVCTRNVDFGKKRTVGYEFGFNGQEKLGELYGEGNAYSFEYRIHDPRIGRFMSVDPLTKSYPHYTPYSFAGNKVIQAIDIEGKEEYFVTEYFDATNGHYKTVIQVVGHVDFEAADGSRGKKIHWSRVDIDANGNANIIYAGSTTNQNGNNVYANSARGRSGNGYIQARINDLDGGVIMVNARTGVQTQLRTEDGYNDYFGGGIDIDEGVGFYADKYNGPPSPANYIGTEKWAGGDVEVTGGTPNPNNTVYLDPHTNAVPQNTANRFWAFGQNMPPGVGGVNSNSGKPMGNGGTLPPIVTPGLKSENEVKNVPGGDDQNTANDNFTKTVN